MINRQHLSVIVTRPLEQAQQVTDLLLAQGFQVLSCPTLAIAPLMPNRALLEKIIAMPVYSCLFTSTNAVKHTFSWLNQYPLQAAHWFAVGRATQSVLAHAISQPVLVGKTSDSEGLLAHPLLQDVRDKIILLFTGENGRELLENSLRSRGAKVEKVTVYRREQAPDTDGWRTFKRVLTENTDKCVLLATSVDSLMNLMEKITPPLQPALFTLPIICASKRIADAAVALGFLKLVAVTDDASDAAMVAALASSALPVK